MVSLKTGFVLTLLSVTVGCSTYKPVFHWGDYEEMLYEMYVETGDGDATTQLVRLEEDIGLAKAENLHIAPGIYAHTGYLYFTQGQYDKAEAAYLEEKALYPESARLIDSLLGHRQE